MHKIVINQNYAISIRLRTYSSFKAALTAGKVSMLGICLITSIIYRLKFQLAMNDVYFLCQRQHVT